ncbi:MAG: LysR family transcriptional regulator [Clostridia bacterium]|nr:LysR family transcriptional regulator [Clostridia bacterium]
MNLLHLKYALEVAKAGSLSKASETLLIAVPNISRSIKDLESDLGIVIFDRTTRGMELTSEGEKLMGYAKSILSQLEQIESYYKNGTPKKQRFSVCAPRASYIAHALAEFSNMLSDEPLEIFYKETNSQRTINNVLDHDYKLGIIRYPENYDKHFKTLLDEKGLSYELICDFTYMVVMSRSSELANKEPLYYSELTKYIEIAHADPYVPSIAPAKLLKEELPDDIERRIYVFERASQFELLNRNKDTFMWVSPIPDDLLDRYGLVQKRCINNTKVYRDVLIYKNGYKLTELDKSFITVLCDSKRKYL